MIINFYLQVRTTSHFVVRTTSHFVGVTFIYFVLLLPRRKDAYKACFQEFNLPFNSSFYFPIKTTSSAKNIHLDANS